MHDESTFALLSLAELPRVGEQRLRALQEYARRTQTPLAQLYGRLETALPARLRLPAAALRRLGEDHSRHRARCAALAQRLAEAGVSLCQPDDAAYPDGWRQRAEPPPIATMYGNAALARRPSVALLHSRLVSDASVTATLRVTRAAAADGLAVVVGGMKTPHRIAAATARALNGGRLVVLDRGLLAAFGGDLQRDPFGLGPQHGRFDPFHTLVLSPFRPDDHAVPRSGRRRDALLAALGDLVVVISARPGGEVERCARAALGRGQRVLVWEDASAALCRAGADRLDADQLDAGLRRWMPAPARTG
ncbi:MAG: DNA-processing protein DprA [Deltaproteobacteria bacterium]|nr:DNA-processing protein DprA [Deltaproteobacteria bacterium]